jgi:hypothetical protein
MNVHAARWLLLLAALLAVPTYPALAQQAASSRAAKQAGKRVVRDDVWIKFLDRKG